RIGPAPRLREGVGADPLPASDRPEVLAFLLLRPVPEQRLAHEAVANRRDDARARVSAREFLDRDRIAHGVEAGPSVFLRHEDAEEDRKSTRLNSSHE